MTENTSDKPIVFETPQGSPMIVFTLQNEGEEGLKTVAIDLGPLTEFGKKEGLTDDQLNQRLRGFEDAMNLVLMNYNISPKKTPLTMEAYGSMQKAMAQDLFEKQQTKQQQQETPSDVGNTPLVEGSEW